MYQNVSWGSSRFSQQLYPVVAIFNEGLEGSTVNLAHELGHLLNWTQRRGHAGDSNYPLEPGYSAGLNLMKVSNPGDDAQFQLTPRQCFASRTFPYLQWLALFESVRGRGDWNCLSLGFLELRVFAAILAAAIGVHEPATCFAFLVLRRTNSGRLGFVIPIRCLDRSLH
jgi:hypothetical protein